MAFITSAAYSESLWMNWASVMLVSFLFAFKAEHDRASHGHTHLREKREVISAEKEDLGENHAKEKEPVAEPLLSLPRGGVHVPDWHLRSRRWHTSTSLPACESYDEMWLQIEP